MKIVYLDTETTSLVPGQICQLSYIIEEDKNITGKNFYFEVDEMDQGAEEIHGLNIENLKELSGGLRLKDIKYEFLKDIDGALVVGHNIDFDLRFVNRGLKDLSITNKTFCTMDYFTNIMQIPGYNDSYKWPKLSELTYFLELDENQIMKTTKKIFNVNNVGFHDSRFDTAAVYLSYKKGIKDKIIPSDRHDRLEARNNAKNLNREHKYKFFNYTTEYMCFKNKVLYHLVKECFNGAENIVEESKNSVCFKLDNLNYTILLCSDRARAFSKQHKEFGLEKEISYTINQKKIREVVYKLLSEKDVLILFKDLCLYLDKQERKCSYSFPDDLKVVMENIELRNKAKDMNLIFYSSGWGWRLRKNWEDSLEKEFQKIEQ